MITAWEIYWITRLDGIKTLTGCAILIAILATLLIMSVCGIATNGKKHPHDKYYVMASVICLCIGGIISCCAVFIPTSKEMAMIKVIPIMANNETIQEECKELYGLAKQGLKELVNDKGEKQ